MIRIRHGLALATALLALGASGAHAEAPETFKVEFTTSTGDFVVEVHRDWAPIGADHFHELVEAKFFDGCRFFRVVPNFIVQFGINGDPKVQAKWREKNLEDEPVKHSNEKGTITYAKSSLPNSRTTQLFVNLKDNAFLDRQGFSPFGKVVEGLDVVQKINAEYGQDPNQARIQRSGNEYLKEQFPKLDYIEKARIVKDDE